MERDHKKRSRAVAGNGSSGADRKKEKETKGKDMEIDPVPVVVEPPTEDEVEEFFAILRRMREAVKYFEKGKSSGDGGKLPEPSLDGDDGVKKRSDSGVLLDLNTVPDEGE
uniref:uncharacterized protein LOC122605425 n=1 Tax=Erigeron canadensis TaxID=72917 RepID=UPI001CB89A1E|nr:uncharacterized protein LOC122605425 [Erigeron canadensis]